MTPEIQLNTLMKQNSEYERLFKYLRDRDRPRAVTDLYKLVFELRLKGSKLSQAETIALFSRMDEAGIGVLSKNDAGRPRFEWNYKLQSVGQAALNPGKAKLTSIRKAGESIIRSRRILNGKPVAEKYVPPKAPQHQNAVLIEQPPTHISVTRNGESKFFFSTSKGAKVKVVAPEGFSNTDLMEAFDELKRTLKMSDF